MSSALPNPAWTRPARRPDLVVTLPWPSFGRAPWQYCEFGAGAAECKAWWKAQHPAVYEHVYGAADEAAKALAAVTLEGATADGEGGAAAAAAGDDAKKTKRGTYAQIRACRTGRDVELT